MSKALDRREADRQAAQQALDRPKPAAERNRLGQFATPTGLALDMARLARQHLPKRGTVSFLDPGTGSGVFFYAAYKALGARRLCSAVGFEIDPGVAAEAARLWGDFGLCVRVQDYCTADPPTSEADKPTLVLCNPPYVRHHHLSTGRKAELRRRAGRLGFHLSGLTGLYGYFLLLAQGWLAAEGVGVWLMPAEFLDVNYGRALKEYLTSRVTLHRIHRFDPDDVQFGDALVSSVVVAFRNAPPPAGHRAQLTSGSRLAAPRATQAVPLVALRPESKWGPLFSRPAIRASGDGKLTVGDLFTVRRGLATGANEFFILRRSQARALGIPGAFLRPILPGPRQIAGACIGRAPDGFPEGLPAWVLLDCDLRIDQVRSQHPSLAAYLQRGEQQGIPKRYLPSHRPLWYKQERRPPAPILCTYMGRQNGGRAIRFIRNKSDATAPNVYLLLYPRPTLADSCRRDPGVIERLFEALTEVASDLAPCGRVYGGGLNKIEPKELEAVALPAWVWEQYGATLREPPPEPDLFGVDGDGETGPAWAAESEAP
jgi:hypothetical protein